MPGSDPPLRTAVRAAAILALLAAAFACVAIGLLALTAQGEAGRVERTLDRADRVTEQYEDSARRFDDTLDDLRRAARRLQELEVPAQQP